MANTGIFAESERRPESATTYRDRFRHPTTMPNPADRLPVQTASRVPSNIVAYRAAGLVDFPHKEWEVKGGAVYRLLGGGPGVGEPMYSGKLARCNRGGGAMTSTGWVSLTLEGTGEVVQWRGRNLELVSAAPAASASRPATASTVSEQEIRKLMPFGLEEALAKAKKTAEDAETYAAVAAEKRAAAEYAAQAAAVAAAHAMEELTKAEAAARIKAIEDEMAAAARREQLANEHTTEQSRMRTTAEDSAAAAKALAEFATGRAKGVFAHMDDTTASKAAAGGVVAKKETFQEENTGTLTKPTYTDHFKDLGPAVK